MIPSRLATALVLGLGFTALQATSANAFCGVLQERGTARNANHAKRLANTKINRAVRLLREQYGRKLDVEPKKFACVGGGVAIDASGKQIVGKPSCTATASYCVNP